MLCSVFAASIDGFADGGGDVGKTYLPPPPPPSSIMPYMKLVVAVSADGVADGINTSLHYGVLVVAARSADGVGDGITPTPLTHPPPAPPAL